VRLNGRAISKVIGPRRGDCQEISQNSGAAQQKSRTGTVHFTSTDQTATLPPDYIFAVADHGVHTFTGVVARKSGTQTIKVIDMLFSSISGSDVFNVP
jgi:hypothetical protein